MKARGSKTINFLHSNCAAWKSVCNRTEGKGQQMNKKSNAMKGKSTMMVQNMPFESVEQPH